MKSQITAALLILFLAGWLTPLPAQVAGDVVSATSQIFYNKMIDSTLPYLSVDQRSEFEAALYPALNKNPELLNDGMELLKEGQGQLQAAAPGRDAYIQRLRDFEARLRDAMTKQDPNVGAIFDQIDAHLPTHAP